MTKTKPNKKVEAYIEQDNEIKRKLMGIMLYKFANTEAFDDLRVGAKKMTREETYDTIVELLVKGALIVVSCGNGKWTIRYLEHPEEWMRAEGFGKTFGGKFEEYKKIYEEMKEKGYEQD